MLIHLTRPCVTVNNCNLDVKMWLS